MTNPIFHFEPSDVFANQKIDPPKWIWDEQLAEGCVTFLCGQPKTGKSSLVRSLIKSVATGADFLGFKTQQCPVAYLALEDHKSFLQKQFKLAGIEFPHVHIHYGSIDTKNPQEAVLELNNLCDDYQIKFLIVDPMIRLLNIADTNDYSEVYKKISWLTTFARSKNVHVMLVHHSNKGKEDNPTQVLGSTGIFGCSDGAFFVSRKEQLGTIKSNLRYGSSLEPVNFTFDQNGLIKYQGTRHEAKESDIGEAILAELKCEPDLTLQELRDRVGARAITINRAIEALCQSGRLLKSGTGKSGNPFTFSIPEPGTEGAEETADSKSAPVI